MDITGVIPLPAANSRKSPSSEHGLNVPAGGSRSSTLPARTWSAIQFDATVSIKITSDKWIAIMDGQPLKGRDGQIE